ncbi:MAG: SPOR domain-containing protein [Gemmatimonadetes bacterium]|nr:SPOR domain-containing protein [Gemmatimonadota bacterium]
MTRSWLVLLLVASPLAAQQDSVLRDAVRLATEGRGDSARGLVRRRLAATPAADSTYAELLYTAGVVAADPDSALRYFRRASIEYSQSAWADQSLLRIAQLSFASGDVATTFSSAQRVLTDYPFSGVRAQAAYWAGRAEIDLGNMASACRLLAQAADSAGNDVELANRAHFYIQRCANLPIARTDSTPADSGLPAPPVSAPAAKPAAAGSGIFAVQVAAVRSVAAADQSMQALKRAGFDSRVTRDPDGLLKVRVGRYKTRAEAQRIATEIRRKLNTTPFVVEEP